MNFRLASLFLAACLAAAAAPRVAAQDRRTTPKLSIAAAANLVYALDALSAAFQRTEPGLAVTTTTGASGSLCAQILNGAPFDVFLSADTDYPRRLVDAGGGRADTLRVFARGQLVVWTTRTDVDVSDLASAIRAPRTRKVAIAQPNTAPYGRAAQAALEKLGVWSLARPKLVVGENISQTAQFVETGNADLGLVAKSLVVSPRLAAKGTWRDIPAELHAAVSLDHAVVLTARGAGNPAARRFLEFLGGAEAKRILRDFGYEVSGTAAAR